jgi:alkanesulfonate monooxygenase SsuD/methylene tetrahydromethanopterin reductase-like flavin-dependent oxidoreductase (luciferase family)
MPLGAATAAEAGGVDGVFVFDHLWPMGAPGRPALWCFAVLGAIAATTERVSLGPFVARIGVLPDDDLVRMFCTLAAVAGPDRLIAAVGAGDMLSADENLAYGLSYPGAAERLSALAGVLDDLKRLGLDTWMGARSPASFRVAEAHAAAVNVWGAPADHVRRVAEGMAVTWGGQVLIGRDDADVRDLVDRHGTRPGALVGTVLEVAAALRALGEAGAEWCVVAPLDYLRDPLRSMETVCLVAEAVR